jgi:6-phosphogluconolactonase
VHCSISDLLVQPTDTGKKMTQQVHRFADVGIAADALSAAIAADLRQRLGQRPRALLLVSGGRSPIPVFEALARQALPWARIDVSLVDERSVAPDHEDANARLVGQHLLTGAAAAATWIPLMPPAVLMQAADAFTAAQTAARLASAEPALAAPAVILLGMGNDGHTASLFADAPQWDEACRTPLRYLALQPKTAPHARISLSLAALRAQGRCYLWAAGADKLATLARLQQQCDAGQEGPAAGSAVACLLADREVQLEVYACGPTGA